MSTENTNDFCVRCQMIQPTRPVNHPSGTVIVCCTCGAHTDFLPNFDILADGPDEDFDSDFDDYGDE